MVFVQLFLCYPCQARDFLTIMHRDVPVCVCSSGCSSPCMLIKMFQPVYAHQDVPVCVCSSRCSSLCMVIEVFQWMGLE